jgi:hypothetical protein
MSKFYLTPEQIEIFKKVCNMKNAEQFEAACVAVKKGGDYPADWFEKIRQSGMADFYYFKSNT